MPRRWRSGKSSVSALAGDGIVVALEGGRKDGVSGGLDVVDLFDVMGEEIRQAELCGSQIWGWHV